MPGQRAGALNPLSIQAEALAALSRNPAPQRRAIAAIAQQRTKPARIGVSVVPPALDAVDLDDSERLAIARD